MPALPRLLHLLAVALVALLAAHGPAPTAALSLESPHIPASRHHDVALSKREKPRRCKQRSNSSETHSHSTGTEAYKSSPSSYSNSHNDASLPKVGIAYPLSDYTPLKAFKTANVGPFYTWSPYCPPEATELGYTCCPMLWGTKQISNFQKTAKPGYAHCALGMNEPNEPSQSNMNPWEAISMWKSYMLPLADHGYTLISPACTNGPSGIKWYKEFFEGCSDCKISALATHYYGTNATDLIAYLVELHDTFNMPIWLTEFACQDFSYRTSCLDPFGFLATAKAFMDVTPWVQTYFAFGVMHDMYNVNPVNRLLGSNDEPTPLGWLYINS